MKLRYLRERKEGGQGDARHLIRLEQELMNLASIKVLCSESCAHSMTQGSVGLGKLCTFQRACCMRQRNGRQISCRPGVLQEARTLGHCCGPRAIIGTSLWRLGALVLLKSENCNMVVPPLSTCCRPYCHCEYCHCECHRLGYLQRTGKNCLHCNMTLA